MSAVRKRGKSHQIGTDCVARPPTCWHCSGKGKMRTGLHKDQLIATCPHCEGSGTKPDDGKAYQNGPVFFNPSRARARENQ